MGVDHSFYHYNNKIKKNSSKLGGEKELSKTLFVFFFKVYVDTTECLEILVNKLRRGSEGRYEIKSGWISY